MVLNRQLQKHARDVANFDPEFTGNAPELTPNDTSKYNVRVCANFSAANLDDDGCFEGFSFTEDWLGPRFCDV